MNGLVIGMLMKEERVLLIKQGYAYHLWELPGGDVEENESFTDAIIREMKEETGLDIEVKSVIAIKEHPNQIFLIYKVESIGGTIVDKVPGEIDAVKWFSKDDVEKEVKIDDFSKFIIRKIFEEKKDILLYDQWVGRFNSRANLYIG